MKTKKAQEYVDKKTNIMDMKGYLRDLIKMYSATIIPWRITTMSESDYTKGWNDCLKETKKNRKKWLEWYEKYNEYPTKI